MTAPGSESARIGIFGGSFNPPHVGHLIIAEIIWDQFELDHILWIPSYQNPLKRPRDLAPAKDRLTMTRLAVADNPHFIVSDVEIGREGVSYTIDTLRSLQDENPTTEYRLILGTDSLQSFSQWRLPNEILRRVSLVAFRRLGSEEAHRMPGLQDHVSLADAPLIQLSATGIRERVRVGRSIRYMVPDAVRHHIEEQRLYVSPQED